MANQNTTDGISNASTEANFSAGVLQKAAVSESEPVILTVYLLFCLIATIAGNGIVFIAVFKKEALHTKHYCLLLSLSVCDILTCITGYPVTLAVLFQGLGVTEWLCNVISLLAMCAFSSSVYILGLLAYERYHFFCHALSYETFFTKFRLSCMLTAAGVVPLGYFITAEVFIGRKVSIADLACRLETPKLVLRVQSAVTIVPVLVVILWSMVRVGLTWAKMRVKIAPQVVEQANGTEAYLPVEGLSNTYRAKTRKIGTAFKFIILLSGLFWGTYLPGAIAGAAVMSKGLAWQQIEIEQNMTAVLVLRYRNVITATVSHVLNPWLYLFTHPELRAAVRQLMRRSSSSASVYPQ